MTAEHGQACGRVCPSLLPMKAQVTKENKMTPTKEVPLITVKVINRKLLEQIYPTRGELDDSPYTDLEEWLAIGKISTTGDVLLRNPNNGEVRLCWLWRYAASKQDIVDKTKFREFQAALSKSLPTIYVS